MDGKYIVVNDARIISIFLSNWWITSFKHIVSVSQSNANLLYNADFYVYRIYIAKLHPDDPDNPDYCLDAIRNYEGVLSLTNNNIIKF